MFTYRTLFRTYPSSVLATRIAIRVIPAQTAFVPLRICSHYTFLDSTLSPGAIVKLASEHDLPAVALTDRGNLHGVAEFAQAARTAGIKAIIGAKLRVGSKTLLAYVASAEGYGNLCRLLSRPEETERDDDEAVATRQGAPFARRDLENRTKGLLAVSNDPDLAKLFPGCFYLAAHSRGNQGSFPTVACPPTHYGLPEKRLRFEVVQSIRTRTLLRQEHPGKASSRALHFRAPLEMNRWFAAHPDWAANSRELADPCDFQFPFGPLQFPDFHPPNGSSPREYLRRLVLKGLQRRYREQANQFVPQVEQELSIIAAVGYEAYFLMVWDILGDCRARGIEWITRGSAADSLVCYCLGISYVCPIRFELYFKRFLNLERI